MTRKIRQSFPTNMLRRAVQHTAVLYEGKMTDEEGILVVDLATPLVNRSLASELRPESWQGIDPKITLEIIPLADGIIVRARTPLFYNTGALGFTSDAEYSFTTTLYETLKALKANSKLPSFSAPPRPPG